MHSAGRVLLLPKGAYNSATTYSMLDIVTYNGASYVCKKASTGNDPTNTEYWQIMSDAGSSNYNYAECSTAAATAAKTATITGFNLVTGARILIKFANTNTASSPTLNISNGTSGTGAAGIRYKGAAPPPYFIESGRVYEFVYDGTYWQMVGDGDGSVWTSAASCLVGDTSKTISHTAIKTTSVIKAYSETASGVPVSYEKIVVSAGQAVITFSAALTEAASIKLQIIN